MLSTAAETIETGAVLATEETEEMNGRDRLKGGRMKSGRGRVIIGGAESGGRGRGRREGTGTENPPGETRADQTVRLKRKREEEESGVVNGTEGRTRESGGGMISLFFFSRRFAFA